MFYVDWELGGYRKQTTFILGLIEIRESPCFDCSVVVMNRKSDSFGCYIYNIHSLIIA